MSIPADSRNGALAHIGRVEASGKHVINGAVKARKASALCCRRAVRTRGAAWHRTGSGWRCPREADGAQALETLPDRESLTTGQAVAGSSFAACWASIAMEAGENEEQIARRPPERNVAPSPKRDGDRLRPAACRFTKQSGLDRIDIARALLENEADMRPRAAGKRCCQRGVGLQAVDLMSSAKSATFRGYPSERQSLF